MLVAFEGIDGSGKGTQVRLVAEQLRSEGLSVATMSFPRYELTLAGNLIGKYLNGQLGANLDPHVAAMLYAIDRRESIHQLRRWQKVSDVVLLDRWVGSNIAHQFGRLSSEDKDASLWSNWVMELEHNVMQIPEADMTILLDVSVERAVENIGKKPKRAYTEKKADLHESNVEHLTEAADMYRWLATTGSWQVINTMQGDVQQKPDEIASQICACIHRKRSVQNSRFVVD